MVDTDIIIIITTTTITVTMTNVVRLINHPVQVNSHTEDRHRQAHIRADSHRLRRHRIVNSGFTQ